MKTFVEQQKITQKWIWFLLIMLNLLFVYAIFQQLVLDIPFGTNPASDKVLVATLIFPISLIIFLKINQLFVRIDENGVYIKYKPYHKSFKEYKWDDIDKAYVRFYKPILEFGGWGLRLSLKKHGGKAFTANGNIGLQLEMKNGKKILIGTEKPMEMKEIVAKYKK